jgi:hypothetical protein
MTTTMNPTVTFETNLVAAEAILAGLDELLKPHAAKLDPSEGVVTVTALRSALANLVAEVVA